MKTIKKLLLILMILVGMFGYSQEIKNHYITKTDSMGFVLKSGSCSSPDGSTTETPILPPNYQYLQDNGYCIYSYATTNTFTACFTFIAGSSSVDVNAGSSQSCNNTSFGTFRLFNSSCQQIGTGLSYTNLTPGQTYTWCLTMRAWGGPSCNGFTSFCPYFLNNIVLPIELLSFNGKQVDNHNYIEWTTSTEQNSSHFYIERSTTGEFTENSIIEYIQAAGTTSTPQQYTILDKTYNPTINYYRLVQVDLGGKFVEYGPIMIDNRQATRVVKLINTAGQQVNEDATGILFEIYNDGTVKKIFK
jgi:hypothetical protein